MSKSKETVSLIITGALIGIIAIVLMINGNPGNMGFCIACFIRDTAGALKLHSAPVVQYLRPEVIGIILGSFLISLGTKEFKVRGGSSPAIRFFLGLMISIGALVFLGCPLRMVLRMSAGDLNAWVGLIGFVAGVYVGTLFLKQGFSLNRAHTLSVAEGGVMPLFQLVLLAILVCAPAALAFSEKGPGSMHAPLALSLGLALVVGVVAQRSRICQAGGIRDVIMFKDPTLLWGSLALLVVALIANMVNGSFNLGFAGQPIAHTEWLWNILGLFIVGLASTFLGGCPMRQLVLTGTGNTDSAITYVGMLVGAAFAHNFGLASSGEGTTANGRIATICIIVILLALGFFNSKKAKA